MADFKTHITSSTAIGCLYGAAGYYGLDVPPAHCLIAASLCGVAGMLPDLDSNSGIPQREMLSFVSVVVPLLMLPRFQALGLSPEHMVFIAGVMYVLIRFGIGALFRRYTKHRGMWHSIPAAAIAGLLTFAICLSSDFEIRIYKAWAVVIGFMVHLVLDEIYAVNWQGKLPKAKKSFGTAIKFWGNNNWANLATYAKLGVIIAVIASDDYVMGCFCETPIEAPTNVAEWLQTLFEHDHEHDHESPTILR